MVRRPHLGLPQAPSASPPRTHQSQQAPTALSRTIPCAAAQFLGALTAPVRRRRLWRHRHEPALCACARRCSRATAGRAGERDRGVRRPLADLLVADPHRHRQICRHPAPGRQQRRGRHARTDGVASRALGAKPGRRPARHRQRGAVLWRRGDHPGAFGAVGGRRASGGPRLPPGPMPSADRRHPASRCSRCSRPRHGRGRLYFFAPNHPHLVHRHRHRRRLSQMAPNHNGARARSVPFWSQAS